MKKLITLVLACLMVIGLSIGCGSKSLVDTAAPITDPNDIIDEMTTEDNKYEIAFIADAGYLKDKSFNQGTYDGVKLYAANANKSYKYYQPAGGAESTDSDRYDAMKLAAENGAKAIVAAGIMQGNALRKTATEYPDIKFIFIDGHAFDDLENVAAISFQEEQCGYLAGFAAVMEGYTKLGFTGGGEGMNAACNRYGYGFIQGAQAAAVQKGVQVQVNYSWLYGASFGPSNELQDMASQWYAGGTEVIFCCGGGMFQSVAAAASAEGAKVIGVDVDQSFESDTVITSAMKGIGQAAQQALTAAESSRWKSEFGGKQVVLSAKEKAVGLPTATWTMENFSVEDYQAVFRKIVDGSIIVDSTDISEPQSTENVKINHIK